MWWRKTSAAQPDHDPFLRRWRHPVTRLLTAGLLIPLNTYLNAEDPTVHGRKQATLGPFGYPWNFTVGKWPPNFFLILVKIVFCIFGFWSGGYIARRFIYKKFLQEWCDLEIFDRGKGQWLIQAIFTVFWLIPVAQAYNIVVGEVYGTDSFEFLKYQINGNLNYTFMAFSRITASLCTLGDLMTLLTVLDLMLQDPSRYSDWVSTGCRKGWIKWRAVLMKVFLFSGLAVGWTLIWTNFWTYTYQINPIWDWVASSEIMRAICAGTIGLLDISVVAQDWEFPSFDNPMQLKVAFLHTENITFAPKAINGQFIGTERVTIEGRWLNYTSLIMTMLLDILCVRGIVYYTPANNAQYVDPNDHIWAVTDVREALGLTESELQWDIRGPAFNSDLRLHALFKGHTRWFVLFLALAPYCLGCCILVSLFRRYNRNPADAERRKRLRLIRDVATVSMLKNIAAKARDKVKKKHEKPKARGDGAEEKKDKECPDSANSNNDDEDAMSVGSTDADSQHDFETDQLMPLLEKQMSIEEVHGAIAEVVGHVLLRQRTNGSNHPDDIDYAEVPSMDAEADMYSIIEKQMGEALNGAKIGRDRKDGGDDNVLDLTGGDDDYNSNASTPAPPPPVPSARRRTPRGSRRQPATGDDLASGGGAEKPLLPASREEISQQRRPPGSTSIDHQHSPTMTASMMPKTMQLTRDRNDEADRGHTVASPFVTTTSSPNASSSSFSPEGLFTRKGSKPGTKTGKPATLKKGATSTLSGTLAAATTSRQQEGTAEPARRKGEGGEELENTR